jgi:hypothetical protein
VPVLSRSMPEVPSGSRAATAGFANANERSSIRQCKLKKFDKFSQESDKSSQESDKNINTDRVTF